MIGARIVMSGAALVLGVRLYNLVTRALLGVDVIGNELRIALNVLTTAFMVTSAIFTFRRSNNRIVRAAVVIGALLVLLGTLLILADAIRH